MPTLVTRGAASVRGFGFAGTTPVLADPYFNYTTLLLHGNGTNGGQNNTFLDSGTANSGSGFTITRNGNTTQGTFSPFSQTGWSNYFDGSSSYLSYTDSSQLNFGTGSYTIEFWIIAPSNNDNFIWAMTGTNTLQITTGGSSSTVGALRYASSGGVITSGSVLITDNAWHHCAIVRNGSTNVTLYIDGVSVATGSDTTNWSGTSQTVTIAKHNSLSSNYLTGYLSNLRVVKGTAVYTSAFTPPTSPLTAISGTSLLTCQSNRFIDNSSSQFALTVSGTPSVQAFSPFAPTAAYDASTIGGSGYFDGSGDYLSIPSNTAFAFGTGDFTVEGWIYYASVASNSVRILATAGAAADCLVEVSTSSELRFYDGSTTTTFTGSTTQANAWNHIAVTRSGTSLRGYINGAQVGSTVTNSANIANTQAINFPATTNYAAAACYISNVRYLKGTALYTGSTYTIPTAPLTNISNTSLLCNFTNAAIIDNTAKNVLETVGNAQISTTQSKFGGGSMSFDGSGDFVQTFASSPNLQFGTGDFTVEGWVYFNASGQHGILQISTNPGGFNTSNTNSIAVQRSATGQWEIYAKNSNPQASATINQSQWYHFAVVRSGTTTTFYVDGVATITVTSDSTNYTGSYIGLGAIYSTAVPLNGYIDDFRITKGIARYTSNFTPQTSQWQDQ